MKGGAGALCSVAGRERNSDSPVNETKPRCLDDPSSRLSGFGRDQRVGEMAVEEKYT